MALLALEALTPIDLKMLAPLLPARLRPTYAPQVDSTSKVEPT
jgi:hypothetical protein